MCKKGKGWVTLLADLGYDAQIIEQKINTSTGQTVKPDIIAVSNRYLHSLVFECKGGKIIDLKQLDRYSTVTADDILRWITVYDRNNLRFDICVSDFEESHNIIKSINQLFPMLTFGSEELFKTGKFKNLKLNDKLRTPINLKDKKPPLFYYPFSAEDKDMYIAFHVVQALLSIAVKSYKGGLDVFDSAIITFDDVIAQNFNYVWGALSDEHKGRLKAKIREVLKRILAKEGIKEALAIIQQKEGYKIRRNLEQFKKGAENFLEELQSQRPLSDFS